jgi:hypothetical protein
MRSATPSSLIPGAVVSRADPRGDQSRALLTAQRSVARPAWQAQRTVKGQALDRALGRLPLLASVPERLEQVEFTYLMPNLSYAPMS